MIENVDDIKKLLELNCDVRHLITLDLNAQDRIFTAIAKKLTEMKYKLVHSSDLVEVQQPTEMEL